MGSRQLQVKKRTFKEDMEQNIPGSPDESQHYMERGWIHCNGLSSLASSCCPMCLLAWKELSLSTKHNTPLWRCTGFHVVTVMCWYKGQCFLHNWKDGWVRSYLWHVLASCLWKCCRINLKQNKFRTQAIQSTYVDPKPYNKRLNDHCATSSNVSYLTVLKAESCNVN